MSDSLQPRGLQHSRLPCPSLSPGVCSHSCTLSRWCHTAFSSLPPSSPFAFSLSQHQGVFQWVGSLPQVAKVLEPQLQHQSFQRVWGLISFRIDRFDLLAAQRTLKSLLHYSSKTSILWHSAFFMVQISHLYMTIGKTIALTIRSLPAKWCLCFLIYSLGLS